MKPPLSRTYVHCCYFRTNVLECKEVINDKNPLVQFDETTAKGFVLPLTTGDSYEVLQVIAATDNLAVYQK